MAAECLAEQRAGQFAEPLLLAIGPANGDDSGV